MFLTAQELWNVSFFALFSGLGFLLAKELIRL